MKAKLKTLGVFLLGLGVGLALGEFALRWQGWEGSTVVSMVGALLALTGLFLTLIRVRSPRRVDA
ncbi:hypothetical protein ON058_01010 [Demequina sp. B12]|uniref:hypothetical protein n=1 Tax=Demequina sp. B12 TaxID=2992757 RepID=UPI00237BDE47|nr:hypothetical protein [Demequina sp. B12]MDE0571993.1 hypothetical protein [Demequina sp. B12]